MRFCPQCGTATVPGGKFCVECGASLASEAVPPAPRAMPPPANLIGGQRGTRFTAAFVGVFIGILIVGLIAAMLIMRHMPQREASRAAAEDAASGLPPGHPQIKLPQQAKDYIKQVQAAAQADPGNLKKWDKLGDVALRASLFDRSYYPMAQDAYSRVLRRSPNDADALRGLGDIYYDHRDYDKAVAAYEHYLKLKPDDPDVLTDLGTMYLYQGNPDQAIVKYNQALKAHPKFFGALFNLGMAYGSMGKVTQAQAAFRNALPAAPDAATRKEVKQMLAQVSAPAMPKGGMGAATMPSSADAANKAAAARFAAENAAAGGAKAKTFEGGFDQMVRGLPVFGPKVQSIDWPAKNKAEVKMANFPMEAMPPFAKRKLLGDLRAGIANLKEAHNFSGTLEVDIEDAATGRVMQTVSE